MECFELKKVPKEAYFDKKYYQNEFGWLDIPKLLSEPPLIAVVTTARGKSKTFGWLKYTLARALETVDIECGDKDQKADEMFLLLRRNQVQLDSYKTDLYKEECIQEALEMAKLDLSDYICSFDVVGSGIMKVYFILKEIESDELHRRFHVGYLSAIPSHARFRGTGLDKVTNIMLDEFSPLTKLDYDPKVVMYFLDICYSVIRKRTNVKIYLAGNPSSVVSEFFIFFGHTEIEAVRKEYDKNGVSICYYNLDIDGGIDEKTPFELLIADTEYGDYAISNQFTDLHKDALRSLTDKATAMFAVKLGESGFVCVWKQDGEYIISRNLGDAKKFTDFAPRKDETRNLDAYRQCYKLLQTSRIYYDTPDIQILFERYVIRYPANMKRVNTY